MQVRKKDTNRIYAMKIIKKSHIVEKQEIGHTMAERNVLAQITHPFIVPIKFSFQSPEKLYLVLAFINGGELFFHLQNDGKFKEDRAKFYAAELLSALDCLHSYNIVYRYRIMHQMLITQRFKAREHFIRLYRSHCAL
jgi:serum/glucocorticoid-regulated kinase 2